MKQTNVLHFIQISVFLHMDRHIQELCILLILQCATK